MESGVEISPLGAPESPLQSIKGLQANKSKEAILRSGKVLGTLEPLLTQFDKDNNVSQPSGAHRSPSIKERFKCNCQRIAGSSSI